MRINRLHFRTWIVLLSIAQVLNAAGTEDFTNFPETGSTYATGTFTGQDGSTWNYLQTRGDNTINSPSPHLGKGRTPDAQVYSGTLTGGIGTLTFDYKQTFSTNVNLEVYVDAALVSTVTSSSESGITKSSGSISVNTTGDFVLKFINTSSSAGQVSIDNVVWTSYTGSVDPEPTNHVTSFTVVKDGTNGHNAIDLSWTANDGAQAPAGFLIKASTTDNVSDPADETAVGDDATIGNNSGAKNITHGTNSYEWTGLTGAQAYYFKIYPYTNSGSDINYKTDATVPNGSATTDAAPVIPDIVINEFQADPDATNGDANGDGTVNTSEDEFVEFVNRSGDAVDISGWVISDAVSDRHTVPGSTSLPDGVALVIFGGGTPTGIPGVVQTASTGSLDLNNSGDGITLKNSSGTTIVTYTYGSEAGDNQAVARDPDYTGGFVKHLTITGNAVRYSPGKTNSSDQSLPVELSIWKATSSNGLVKLLWTTDSEIENQGFIIERIQETGDRSQNVWKEIASFTSNPGLLGQGSISSQNDYSYIDKQVKVGKSYSYRLSDVDYRGNITRHAEIKVTVKDAGSDLKPSDVKLHKAFPNPFNPDVNLSFTLENEVQELSLEIYDIQGVLVQTLSSGYTDVGTHDFNWSGYDSFDNAAYSGVYIVRLSAGSVVQIQRVTLLR